MFKLNEEALLQLEDTAQIFQQMREMANAIPDNTTLAQVRKAVPIFFAATIQGISYSRTNLSLNFSKHDAMLCVLRDENRKH